MDIPYVLAGIVEVGGGIRVVVTAEDHVQYHVQEGEQAYIVPDCSVDDLVAKKLYASLIKIATDYIKSRQEQSCPSH